MSTPSPRSQYRSYNAGLYLERLIQYRPDPKLDATRRPLLVTLCSMSPVHSLEATMSATTGGFKTVLNTDTQQTYQETFTGATNSKTVVVTFDFEAPKHCSRRDTCTDDNTELDVGRDIDNDVSTVSPPCGHAHRFFHE